MLLTIVDLLIGLFLIDNADGFLYFIGWLMTISGGIGIGWFIITLIISFFER